MKGRPIIYLNYREGKAGGKCVLYFKQSDGVLRRIKQNGWISWDNEISAFATPSNEKTIGHLMDVFEDIADINQSYYHARLEANTEQVTLVTPITLPGF